MTTLILRVDPDRIIGRRDERIFGQFLEHFHRQVYGGIFDPGSRLADASGLRTDVVEALRAIRTPVIRWPGGCFVSSHHWKDAVGPKREATFDKAWRVEEPNTFGTDEFMALCAAVGAAPYICTNAGTGSAEEMSDWVEYCNLDREGKWAKQRIANGHPDPYRVRYWSIGNENYGRWEMGAKSAGEWGRTVLEAAKMMKRVDPGIEIFAASLADLDWNLSLLKEAGPFLDWISIHGYWDPIWTDNKLADYETCMAYTMKIAEPIRKARHILGAMGYLDRIRIAFDEWNLRGWYHPHIHDYADVAADVCAAARDANDRNESYTMADAVFSACFLNQCLKQCDIVKMANFAPAVNTRGVLYVHPDGLVKRTTYHVFEMFTQSMREMVVDAYLSGENEFSVRSGAAEVPVETVDAVATRRSDGSELAISLVNKHPELSRTVEVCLEKLPPNQSVMLRSLSGDSKDAYNDIDRPNAVRPSRIECRTGKGVVRVELPAHSVNVLSIPL